MNIRVYDLCKINWTFNNTKKLAQIINELKLLLVKQESIVETECNCPHCNSTNFIKYGKRNEYQCYICKECKKTFTKKTNTITHYSKISKEIWESFIEYEFAGMTLKEESYFTHLSKMNYQTIIRFKQNLS